MPKFTYSDFSIFEKSPVSPTEIQNGLSSLMVSTKDVKSQVVSINEQTGAYRIVLQGTLNLDTNI